MKGEDLRINTSVQSIAVYFHKVRLITEIENI